ncbi:MAG: hypothetical protein ACKOW9_05290, partial [Candidatus Paceibacterota bacterium]
MIKFIKNSPTGATAFYIMLNTALTSLLGFAYWSLAASKLAPNELGIASTGVPVMGLAFILSSSGLVATIMVFQSRGNFTKNSFITLSLLLPILSLALTPLLIKITGDNGKILFNKENLYLLLLGAALTTLSAIVDAVLITAKKSFLMLVKNVLTSLLKLIALALNANPTPSFLLSTYAFSLVVTLFFLRPSISPLPKISDNSEQRVTFKKTFKDNHISSISSQMPSYILPLIVTNQIGTSANAVFYIAWLISGAFFMISPALSSAYLTTKAKSHDGSLKLFKTTMIANISLIILASSAMYAISKPLLNAYQPGYAQSANTLLLILVASSLPNAVTN